VRTVARGAAAALALCLSAWTSYGAASTVAAEPVDLGGQPVSSSTDKANPTPLDPGLWTATLGVDSLAQFFGYQRQIEDSTIHVGVVGAPQTLDSDGLDIATTVDAPDDPDGVDCGTDSDSYDSSVTHALMGVDVVVGDEDGDDGSACRGADMVLIELSRNSTSNIEDLPIAIKIVEEAPVSDPGEPPDDSEELGYDLPEPAETDSGPDGAASFDDAPIIDARSGPVTVSTRVTEGTEVLWRVPLDWGDQLVVRADLPAANEEFVASGSSVYLTTRIFQPSRDDVDLTADEDVPYGYYGAEPDQLVAAAYPLRYSNRFVDVPPTLPGDHWVSIAVAPPPESRTPIDVPVELTFGVTSTDAPAPTYKAAVLAQGGGAGPKGYGQDTPYLVADDTFAAVASGNPFTPESGDDDPWWGPRRGVGLGVGVISLACCAVGAVWLRRRRAG
jgi:hypothetical protein